MSKILFVHPATEMTIGDVARGYRGALASLGHEVHDYYLNRRLAYHMRALPDEIREGDPIALQHIVSRVATETLAVEALYTDPDLVIVISGLNTHPIGLWLMAKLNIPVAVIFTESPYEDENQAEWVKVSKFEGVNLRLSAFCNDRYSAEKFGWTFLPASFDPKIHHPVDPNPEFECDVLMIGTGWPERQRLLEAVDWSGIDLRLYGVWPNIGPESPLHKFYYPSIISNVNVPAMYCSAKVNLNIHRASDVAFTPGPRVYELAACGAFQLSDPREDLNSLFRGTVPTFSTPEELGEKVRYYLAHPEERRSLAAGALDSVCDEDFDKRAATLINTLEETHPDLAAAANR